MKPCSINKDRHNLNLQMYSFAELLNLFHLGSVSSLTEDDMKRAKLVVLKMHPDKSRLPPDYFLFYKKAFDIVLEYYRQQQRVDQPLPKEEVQYMPSTNGSANATNVAATLEKMDKDAFHDRFNQLFENNMLNKAKQTEATSRLQWFTQDAPEFDMSRLNCAGGAIHQHMDTLKEQQSSQHLATYRGVQPLYARGGNSFYEDDDDTSGTGYIDIDPFSKLKYDDLRKVHKDQTVIPVRESDLNQVTMHGTVEELNRARSRQDVAPLSKMTSEQLLTQQKQQHAEEIARKEYQSKLQTLEYENKSKTVLSHFLRLGNQSEG